MNLPVPSPEGLEKFKVLYRKHMGKDVPEEEAYELARRYLVFVFFGITRPPGVTEEQGEERTVREGKRKVRNHLLAELEEPGQDTRKAST